MRVRKGFPVRYVYWPAYSLRTSMLMMDMLDFFPEQSAWVFSTRRKLERDLQVEITILNELALIERLLHEQLRQDFTSLSVPEFVRWISTVDFPTTPRLIPSEDEVTALHGARARFDVNDQFADWRGVRLAPSVVDRIRNLIGEPEELKSLAIRATTRFWDDHLEPEFRRLSPSIRKAVDRGNQNTAPRTGRELILELVGREPAADSLDENVFDEVLAIPVCHLGSFVLTLYLADGSYALTAFEAGRTPTGKPPVAAQTTASTYRALSDETRLSIVRMLAGEEMYGMEIVNACGLSQPTVSKHLRILVAEGILLVRREGGAKHYSVNEARLAQIGDSIEGLSR